MRRLNTTLCCGVNASAATMVGNTTGTGVPHTWDALVYTATLALIF
jgi:hypothetical protein